MGSIGMRRNIICIGHFICIKIGKGFLLHLNTKTGYRGVKKRKKTRKSCVNGRGIPTAAYQVLHLLSCTGWGVPYLGGGDVPHAYQGDTPSQVPPCPDLAGRAVPHPCWVVPHLGYPPDLASNPPLTGVPPS